MTTNKCSIIKYLKDLKNGERKDRIFYIVFLKEWGELGQRLYQLKPDPELKNFLIWLSSYIQIYESEKFEKIIQ